MSKLWWALLAVVFVLFACGNDGAGESDEGGDRGGSSSGGGSGGASGSSNTGGASATSGGGTQGLGGTSGTNGTGGSDVGGGGTAGSGGTAGTGTVACTLPSVQMSQTLDYDVKTFTVSGTISLNGGALPDHTATRGSVVFRNRATSDARGVPLSSTGAGTYTLTLFEGHYDVTLETASPAPTGLPPAAETRIVTDLVVDANRTLDYDAKTVTLTGTVTLNGGVLPDFTATRGSVVFQDTQTGNRRGAPLPSTGAGSYSVTLFASTYDVTLETASPTSAGLPATAEVQIASDLAVSANRTLDYDAKTATITGTVTLNGGVLPDFTATRGSVVFREKQTGDRRGAPLPSTGAGSYSVTLLAGTYDVTLETASPTSAGLPATAEVKIASDLALSANRMLDYDAKTVTMTGTVTLNGGALPDFTATRGSVVFQDTQTGDRRGAPLPSTGAGSYSVTLFASTYDVTLETASPTSAGLPATAEVGIASDLAVSANRTLDYDAKTATITGAVTLNGGVLPDFTATRGSVVFREKQTGDRRGAPLPSTGTGSYSVTLLAGTYDVTLETASPTSAGLPPAAETRIASNVALTANRTLDVDTKAVTVTGTVTLNGGALPDHTATRGSVVFRNQQTVDLRGAPLESTGPGAYTVLLLAGVYDVTLETASPAPEGLPAAAETRLDVGCPETGACTASASDLTGRWDMTFESGNVGPALLDLIHAGDTFSGSIEGSNWNGTVTSGSLSGGEVHLVADVSTQCGVVYLDGSLTTPCTLLGIYSCGTSLGTTGFTAIR